MCNKFTLIRANLCSLISAAHYKAFRVLTYNFNKKKSRHDQNKCGKRASRTEWSHYVQANFVIKTHNSTNGPAYLTEKIRESLFVTRRQPRIGKFFNNARGKIGKQSLENRLKFMEAVTADWQGIDLDDSARHLLWKRSFFKYFS